MARSAREVRDTVWVSQTKRGGKFAQRRACQPTRHPSGNVAGHQGAARLRACGLVNVKQTRGGFKYLVQRQATKATRAVLHRGTSDPALGA